MAIAVGISSYSGSASHLLNHPYGIFVTINLDLYVADWGYNHRIQFFRSGQIHEITVAGNGSNEIFTFSYPSGVTLDAVIDIFSLLIVIIIVLLEQNSSGYRCLIGCSGNGSTSDRMYYPQTLSFDHNGNMFVTDTENHRTQKFTAFAFS